MQQLHALYKDDPDFLALWAVGNIVRESMETATSAFATDLLREQQQRNMQTTQQWLHLFLTQQQQQLQLFSSTILAQQQQQQADLLRVANQLHQFPVSLGSDVHGAVLQACDQLGLLEVPHQHQPTSQTSASPLPANAQGADTSSLRSSAGASLPNMHAAARPPCNLTFRLPNDIPIGPVFNYSCSCGLIHRAQLVQRMSVPAAGAAGVVSQQVRFLLTSDAIAGC